MTIILANSFYLKNDDQTHRYFHTTFYLIVSLLHKPVMEYHHDISHQFDNLSSHHMNYDGSHPWISETWNAEQTVPDLFDI